MSYFIGRDAHERERAFVERPRQMLRLTERWGEHQSVRVGLIDETEHFSRELHADSAALVHEELKASLATTRHRAMLHVHDVVRARVRVHEPDEVRAPTSESARGDARMIVERPDRGLHTGAGHVADVR